MSVLAEDIPDSVRNKRRFPRVAVSVPARLLQPGAGPFPCTIVDISSGGARVRLGRGDGLAPETVLIDLVDGLAFEARVAWRNGAEAGLTFTRRHELKGFVPAHLLAAKTVWLRDREQPPVALHAPEPPAPPAPPRREPPPASTPPSTPSAARKAAATLVNTWRGRMTLEN